MERYCAILFFALAAASACSDDSNGGSQDPCPQGFGYDFDLQRCVAIDDAGLDDAGLDDTGVDAAKLDADAPDDASTGADAATPQDAADTSPEADASPEPDTGEPTCSGGLNLCDGECVDLQVDPDHCGACGAACSSGDACEGGNCIAQSGDCRAEPCTGFNYCDLASGECKEGCAEDTQCASSEVCELTSHTCECAPGFHECDGSCVPDGTADNCVGVESEPNDTPADLDPLPVDDSIQGVIEDRGAASFDDDYFGVTVNPGQTVRLEVSATGDLQPVLEVFYVSGSDAVSFAIGRPVSGGAKAAVEFSHPNTLSAAAEYIVRVSDARNSPVDEGVDPQNVGGATYGYTLLANQTNWTSAASALPLQQSSSLAQLGDYEWYEFTAPAQSILVLDASTRAADFTPLPAVLSQGGIALVAQDSVTTVVDTETQLTAGVRDEFFRGGAGYDFAIDFRAVSFAGRSFSATAESEPNDAPGQEDPITASLPAAFNGQLSGTDATSFDRDRVTVTLGAGDNLVLFTEDGTDTSLPGADTVVTVIDPTGNEVLYNDDYFLQRTTYFSAGAVTARDSGNYTIIFEPYCTNTFCDGGDYTANIFVE